MASTPNLPKQSRLQAPAGSSSDMKPASKKPLKGEKKSGMKLMMKKGGK